MNVIVTGGAGQLAAALQRQQRSVILLPRSQLDVTSPESISAAIQRYRPTHIINAAAYTAVDRAEKEPLEAYTANALGPRYLAQACNDHGCQLIHISTDYVFGLESQVDEYTEDDCPGPVNVYGSTKLAGEYFVRTLCADHLVIRTCGLYGAPATNDRPTHNFVNTMLRLAEQRETGNANQHAKLRIVADQYCTPTNADDAAAAIFRLIAARANGLFHVTNSGGCNWAEFAEQIFKVAKLEVNIDRIPSSEYPTLAKRPANSRLCCSKYVSATGDQLRPWQEALADYVLSFTTSQ